MQQANFQPVNYPIFRETLNQNKGHRIKNLGYETLLYDKHNKLIALMKAASIEHSGYSQPTRYYIRSMCDFTA